MALSVTTALLLAQMSVFVTSSHYCRNYTYTPVGWNYCGGKPNISNDPAILRWISTNGSFGGSVDSVEVDLRKVDNAWSQTGCFNLGQVLSGSGNTASYYSYTIPSSYVDYDSLYIARLLWADSAGNRYHIKDGDCYFTLQPTPSAPLNVTAVDVTSSSITWIWDKPTNHSSRVTHYQVYRYYHIFYYSDIDNATTGTYYKWTGLSSNTQYSIRVRAVTGSGKYGSWSSWEYVYTLPPVPSHPIVSIGNSAITSRSVVLTLSGCTAAGDGAVKYSVRYGFAGGNGLTAETDTSDSLLTVTDLRPVTQYTFTVTCVNSAFVTGPNVTRHATTLAEDTLRPSISSVRISVALDSATVAWNAPSAQVTVTGYDVQVVAHVRGIPQPPSVYLMVASWYSTSYRVRQRFTPETVYTFQVRARTSVGTSQWSTPVVRSTLPADTLQLMISSVETSDTQATVQWDTLDTLLNVTGYEILVLRQAGATPQGNSMVSLIVGLDTLYKVVHGLTPETVYTFQVRARTSVSMSQWSAPVVRSTLPAVPLKVDGFTASSLTSTSITVSWNEMNSTIEYYKLTLHNVAANTTEHYDLFHTVNSHTFHNLSPNTAYSVTITAVNKAGSGPTASLNVTTRGPDRTVSPLVITTGTLGAMVVIVIVAVPLLVGCTWRVSKAKGMKLNGADEDNCELRESVAYVTTSHSKQWGEGSCEMEEEEGGCKEEDMSANDELEALQLEKTSPQIPSRKYLQEKKKGPTVFASIPVFDVMDFKEKSGWHQPTVADVLAGKLEMGDAEFSNLGSGVYFMHHRTKEQAKWVGLSPDLCRTLCGLFFQLYQKERSKLSPLEVELKFFSPLAADWDIKVWTADPKELVVERAKKIVEYKTLKPLGLNNSLKFITKEMWEDFTSWFVAQKRQQS